jgi:hypothetical protein
MYQQRAEVLAFDRAQALGVTIVMPCLNETISLPHCIANAKDALAQIEERFGLAGEIVIADNGSTDGSQALAESLGARVVPVARRGYGAALIGGCTAAYGDYILMGDCDGSYNFTEGVAMIGKLIDGHDLCMGSRFDGGIAPGAMPWKNRHIGNPALTGILNLFFRSGINDAHCGLRAIRKEAFDDLGLAGEGMEFASEMVIKASLKKMKVVQVPATLSVDLRDRAPHLRPWRDGWRHLRYLLMLSPTWVFGVPAMLAVGSGALILLVALAHLLGIIGGEPLFGASWTIAAGFLVSVGHLAAIMALATHFHGVNRGYRTLRPVIRRYADWLTLETMLLAGALLLLASGGGIAALVYYWSQTGFNALTSVLPTVLALTGATVAIQTILGGFLLAIINGHRATLAPGGEA